MGLFKDSNYSFSTWLISLLTLAVAIQVTGISYAEEVTGCPLGLRKGELWIRQAVKLSSADKYYNKTSGDMEELPEGWHQKVWSVSNRIGYGITDRLEAGVLFPYKHMDMKQQKQSQWLAKKNYGFEELWLSSAFKFIDNEEGSFFEAAKVGVGLNLETNSDALVKNGLGDGAMAARIVFLSHEHLTDKLDLCNDFYYEWIGKARNIEGWEKSNWEYGDKVGYKFFVEYSITPTIRLAGGPIGWMEVSKTKMADDTEAHSKFYVHNASISFAYLPTGDERDHKKLVGGVNIPYSSLNNFSPDVVLNASYMWTF